jgi:acyl dehydratase
MSWWSTAVGRQARLTRVFTEEDVAAYNALAGDDAPDGVVPEPLVAGLFSKLLGVDLPGSGTNYLKQRLSFASPARTGEPLTAVVEVRRVVPEKQLAYLETRCLTAEGDLVCDGQALVLARGVEPPPGR